jgi:hypothetical protein
VCLNGHNDGWKKKPFWQYGFLLAFPLFFSGLFVVFQGWMMIMMMMMMMMMMMRVTTDDDGGSFYFSFSFFFCPRQSVNHQRKWRGREGTTNQYQPLLIISDIIIHLHHSGLNWLVAIQ